MYKYYLLLPFLICMGCLASCNSDLKMADAEAYEEQKQNLAGLEKTKPLSFLHVKSDNRKNWVGQTVVSGFITNTAVVSSYKNVRLKMLCYDAQNKIVEEHEDVLDAVIKPNTERIFKLRYRLPRTTDSIVVSVMSAAVAK